VWSAENTPTAPSPGVPVQDVEADLSDETLARVDALAREQGISREDMLRKLTGRGITAEEKRRDGK
jgi:hypothetical protein